MTIATKLINWYEENKRDLPWRKTKDPYKIWVSEVILQQTRVQQGLGYYYQFINKFPTIRALAIASEDEVLLLWQGLGYYSRARNIHFSAKYITRDLNGIFPNNYKSILQLKGVGDYIASAVASFAFGENTIALDGNAYRVLSRIRGIKTTINTPQSQKEFKQAAIELKGKQSAATFNQTLMEMGATCCLPSNPQCTRCPVSPYCYALQNNMITQLPTKKQKTKVLIRYFHYVFILINTNYIFIEKRTKNDIWKNLYQLPLFETQKPDIKEFWQWEKLKGMDNTISVHLNNTEPILHKLSHRTIFCHFWIIKLPCSLPIVDDYKKVALKDLKKYAFPILIKKHIEEFILESFTN